MNKRYNHKNRKGPSPEGTKTCFVTKTIHPREEMLRFVVAPDKTVCFDVAEKLPGRGMWIRADRHLLEQAVSKKLFYKAAHGTVKIPSDLSETVDKQLRQRCLALLALCRKAGLMVFGFEAVKKAIITDTPLALFEAQDASEREQTKLHRPHDTYAVFSLFTREELGIPAGADTVTHMLIKQGPLSKEVVKMAQKLTFFNGAQAQE